MRQVFSSPFYRWDSRDSTKLIEDQTIIRIKYSSADPYYHIKWQIHLWKWRTRSEPQTPKSIWETLLVSATNGPRSCNWDESWYYFSILAFTVFYWNCLITCCLYLATFMMLIIEFYSLLYLQDLVGCLTH